MTDGTKQTPMKRKIYSVEELYNHAQNGIRVSCDSVGYLIIPRKASSIMGCSCKSLMNMIKRGLYAHGVPEGASDDGILIQWQAKIKATGLSHSQLADKWGIGRRAVTKFLNSKSVQTSSLEEKLRKLELINND